MPGILFRDITPLLGNPALLKKTIDALCRPFSNKRVDYIAGVEARGFLLASAMAYKLKTGLVPIRKKGKLPFKTVRITYKLEYGQDTVEIHRDAVGKGSRVLLVDDVLATGGTAKATAQAIEKAGGKIVGIVFLIELLALKGRAKISNYPIHALLRL